MAGFTITDLKKHLGPGLGLRKNKYLIEIPVPGIEGQTLNILCRSAGLPERNINTTEVFKRGRKYVMRGETDYINNYDVSIVDDSNMRVRKIFDKWMTIVDKSKPDSEGFLGASYEAGLDDIVDTVRSGLGLANTIKNAVENPQQIADFFLGFIDTGNAVSSAKYQTDINIWQLSSTGEKVYGYKLQNAFPNSLGIVTLDDGDENTLSEFTIVFSYSEITPLENKSALQQFGETAIGDSANDVLNGVEALFE